MKFVILATAFFLLTFDRSVASPLQIQPEFCPSEDLRGVECLPNREGTLPTNSSSINSTVALLRCYAGCLNNEELAINKANIDFSQPWPYFDPETLPSGDSENLTACRFRCAIVLLTTLSSFICQSTCLTEPIEACRIGCTIGGRIKEAMSNENSTYEEPPTPTATPPAFFDPESSEPWLISLNLTSVVPVNFSVPVIGSRSVAAIALEFVIPDGDTNITFHYSMFHPQVGVLLMRAFLSYYRCSVMYLSVSMVNEFGFTPMTPHVRLCIPGVYQLSNDPGQDWSPRDFILEGSKPSPSLGTILISWGRAPEDDIFEVTGFEVRAQYLKSDDDQLNDMCLDGGNLSGGILEQNYTWKSASASIVSGDHGLIKLIRPDIFCVYRVNVTSVWHADSVVIPFLRDFRKLVSLRVEVIFKPFSFPSLELGITLEPKSDGTYQLKDLYGCLNPPENKFFEAFNSVRWSILRLVQNDTRTPGPNAVDRILVDEVEGVQLRLETRVDNPCTSAGNLTILLPRPAVLNLSIFEQLSQPNSIYRIDVTPNRSQGFPNAARNYLDFPTPEFSVINPEDIPPVAPGPPEMVTVDSCVVREGEMSLRIQWTPPSFTFGRLTSCALRLLGMGMNLLEEVQPTELSISVNYSVQVDRFQQQENIEVEMFCTNEYDKTGEALKATYNSTMCLRPGLETNVSTLSLTPSSSLKFDLGEPTTIVSPSSTPVPPSEPTEPPTPQPFQNIYIAIGAGSGLIIAMFLVFFAIMCFFCCRRRRSTEKSEFWEMKRTRSFLRRNATLNTTGDDWELDPSHLYMNNKLGEGNFGEVYKATLSSDLSSPRAKKYAETVSLLTKAKSPCFVAIKVLKTNAPSDMKQSFLNEIKMMKTVASGTNIHVVKMIGCVTIQEPLALILEFVPYGNLLDYLRTNRKLAQKRRQLKSKHHQQRIKANGDHGRYVAGVLTPIEESSLHSMSSAPYLRDSEINRRSSEDSYFSHLTPQDTPKLSASPVPCELKDQTDSLEVSSDFKPSASPYTEPVHFLGDDSSMGHNRPASYIQPIVSPLLNQESVELVELKEGEPSAANEEVPSRKESGSSVNNPLYDDLEFRNPYPDLGELEAFNLMMFAYQIASGMEYLASLGIVHRDLACRNVLVDRDKILKISDFGLSRETDLYVSSTQGKLPLRWMSPEAILDRVFTEKSDVWAYGITIWEICTLGGYPYATIPNKAVLQSLISGYRLEKPHNCSEEIHKVMLHCWEMDSDNRPNFQELREHLDNLMEHHQADKYIKFSDIDDDKLPYYKVGMFSGSGSGSGDDNPFESGNGTLPPRVTLEPVRTSNDPQEVVASNQTNQKDGLQKVIPISPQSSGGTIKDESIIGDDSNVKKKYDTSAENSQDSLTAQDSACTINGEDSYI